MKSLDRTSALSINTVKIEEYKKNWTDKTKIVIDMGKKIIFLVNRNTNYNMVLLIYHSLEKIKLKNCDGYSIFDIYLMYHTYNEEQM